MVSVTIWTRIFCTITESINLNLSPFSDGVVVNRFWKTQRNLCIQFFLQITLTLRSTAVCLKYEHPGKYRKLLIKELTDSKMTAIQEVLTTAFLYPVKGIRLIVFSSTVLNSIGKARYFKRNSLLDAIWYHYIPNIVKDDLLFPFGQCISYHQDFELVRYWMLSFQIL